MWVEGREQRAILIQISLTGCIHNCASRKAVGVCMVYGTFKWCTVTESSLIYWQAMLGVLGIQKWQLQGPC